MKKEKRTFPKALNFERNDSERCPQEAETDLKIKVNTVCIHIRYRRGGSEATKQEQRPPFISCNETEYK